MITHTAFCAGWPQGLGCVQPGKGRRAYGEYQYHPSGRSRRQHFRCVKDVLKDHVKDVIDISALPNTALAFPGLVIQADTGIVLRNGCPMPLNCGEFSMLCHLTCYPKIILSRDQLYTAAYGENHFNSNTIPNTIGRIRSKIEPDPPHLIYIKTVVGMGYRFESPKFDFLG